MAIDILKAEGRSLEEEFFAKVNNELKQKIKAQETKSQSIKDLAQASGITNQALLETLLNSNISAPTLQAFSLIPLVRVAWADGQLDPKERDAILKAAEEQGLDSSHPGYEALKSWLQEAPSDRLFESWKSYVHELANTMNKESFAKVQTEILSRTRKVAEAAGGILGLAAKVSAAEKAELAKIEAAFTTH
jgi:hypothetical protein